MLLDKEDLRYGLIENVERGPMLFSLASDKDAAVADLREGGRNGDHWSIQIRRHFQGLGNGCSGLLQVHSFGEDARSKDRQTDSLQWKQERNGKFVSPTVFYVVGVDSQL